MFVSIAVPAIQQILNNFISNISDATGDCYDYEEAASFILEKLTSDEIFGLLIETLFTPYEDLQLFISLRGEIEHEMLNGKSYSEAIAEWYK